MLEGYEVLFSSNREGYAEKSSYPSSTHTLSEACFGTVHSCVGFIFSKYMCANGPVPNWLRAELSALDPINVKYIHQTPPCGIVRLRPYKCDVYLPNSCLSNPASKTGTESFK